MNKLSLALAMTASLALAACGSGEAADPDAAAQDFSNRIKGSQTTPGPEQVADASAAQPAAAPAPPTVAEPLPNAAPGAFSPGTATDPAASTCGANLMGPFIGRPADDVTRAAILETASATNEVRFVPAGSPYIRPDPTHPRLNLMIDNIGVIRDARCG